MPARLLSLVAALLLALCAGAVWSVVTLWTRDQAAWMALPAAAVAVFAAATVPARRPLLRAGLAAACTVLSTVYAYVLGAASVVAASLDVPFIESLRRIGPEMAFAIAQARTGPVATALLLLAPVLAAVVAFRWPPRAKVNAADGIAS